MTTETIHTCSYECERPECIRAQRDELAARLTAETSNARGEWVLVPRVPTGAMVDAWRDAPERWVEAYAAMLAAAPQPPSAPVGVGGKMAEVVRFLMGEAPLEGRWFDEPGDPHVGGAYWWRKHLTDALAQQPAAGAVDKARFKRAPCYLCGYNGPGYYQPDTHPCAAKYHATQHQEPTT